MMRKFLLAALLALSTCTPAFAAVTTHPTTSGVNTGSGSGGSVSITAVDATHIVVNPSPGTGTMTIDTGSAVATSANTLGFFASTTSSALAGVISDETGSGSLVFANAPTLTSLVLGSATGGNQGTGSLNAASLFVNDVAVLTVNSALSLGTSTSATNPQRSGQTNTGLYSATSNTVSIAESGTDVADFAAAGVNIATGSLKLAGNNGIIYPNSTSVVIGPTGATALTGIQNTSVGDLALTTATTGTNNTAVGYNAGSGITSGIDNTCFGSGTNCGGTASDDVAIGFNAIASSSQATSVGSGARAENGDVAIGYHTLNGATTGANSFDTAVGFESLQGNTTGIDNVAVGAIAGQGTVANTSGSQNVWVGYSAHSGGATDTNEIVIGYMGAGTGSNSTTIGTSNTTAAKIFGTLTSSSFTPTSSTIPSDGVYLPATNTLAIADRSLEVASFTNPASAVNFLTFTGSATGVAPTISNAGTDTHGAGLNLNITAKSATASGAGGSNIITAGAASGTNQAGGSNSLVGGANTGTGLGGTNIIAPSTGCPALPTYYDAIYGLIVCAADNALQMLWSNTAGTAIGALFSFLLDPQTAVQIGSYGPYDFGVFTNLGSVQAAFRQNGGLAIGLNNNTTTPPANGLSVGGPVQLMGYTVSTLPSGSVGEMAYVTDAVACTFLGSLTGSGSAKCPVFYNGSAWVGG